MASYRFASAFLIVLAVLFATALTGQAAFLKKKMPLPREFHFEIDDAMPLHELLPVPPAPAKLPGVLNEDLALVPELFFGEPIYIAQDCEEKMAHIMAKINRLNAEREDGFMKTLLANRADLRGLPVLMGKQCRTEIENAKLFALMVKFVRPRLGPLVHQLEDDVKNLREADLKRLNRANPNHPLVWAAKDVFEKEYVAAVTQMSGALSERHRGVLAKHLATVEHADATRALAKLAMFAPEETVRAAAIDGLKSRNAKEYADVLLQGFRYPLPALSKRAAEALVQLQAKDALADLVNILEEPDPRAPFKKEIDGKHVSFVRELVRVNHHHNCLLCHAPANTGDVPEGVLTAPVPLPDRALASPLGGYGQEASPDIFVRIDITYLRQDFSLMMKVEKRLEHRFEAPWPEMQRFDFFVREREITSTEKAEIEKQLAKVTPPNQVAAQSALRQLTGRTEDLTAAEWRKVVGSAQR